MTAPSAGRPRVAVVTGAASGAGPAVARALAADGWGLALGEPATDDASRARLEEVAGSCRGRGVAVTAHACDTRRPAEVGRLVAEGAALGPVQAAVALSAGALSAGALPTGAGTPAPAWQLPPADLEAALDAHYRGLVVLARAAVPHLLDAGERGRFVAVLRVAGGGDAEGAGAGADAAGAAGLAFLRRLAGDLRPSGVTANAVLAGADGADGERVAAVVAWACSAGSAGVTGATLPLGGQRSR